MFENNTAGSIILCFVTIGMDFLGRALIVVYTYRNNDIRLISARTATKRERETMKGVMP